MTPPQIAGNVYAGDTLPLDFQVMNLGRSTVYNVRCDIKGEGLLATSTAFIGNLEAGTEGTITLTYEDADGKQYTSESTFSTNIQEPQVPVIVKEEPKPAGKWWTCAGIIAIIAGMCIYRYKKRQSVELLSF